MRGEGQAEGYAWSSLLSPTLSSTFVEERERAEGVQKMTCAPFLSNAYFRFAHNGRNWPRCSDSAISGTGSLLKDLFHQEGHDEHEEKQSNLFQNFMLFVFFVVRIKADLTDSRSRPPISAGAPGGLFVSVT
jgi:hypothetical protein